MEIFLRYIEPQKVIIRLFFFSKTDNNKIKSYFEMKFENKNKRNPLKYFNRENRKIFQTSSKN